MFEPLASLTPLVPPQDTIEPFPLDGSARRGQASPVSASAELYVLSKVTVPPVRVKALSRSLQLAQLDNRVPLTLLVAGAGYGKTTLLSSWAYTTPGYIAWLTLESLENDPLRFWAYVLLALRPAVPSLGEHVWTDLATADVAVLPSRLASLLNTLLLQDQEVTLILDDYQVIEEPSIHQSLAFLLAHAPASFRLILSSRTDPALPLARLRARGQVVEIRETHLRLSLREAEQFLTQIMGLALSKTDVQVLTRRTEGWIAGLQLAALALRAHADPSQGVPRISGSHRYLVEYVQEDILASVDPPTQTFLRQVSILTQMAASLCQAVTGEETSAQLLLTLEQANLFVVPLDDGRRWYRLHPLVREALLAQMQAQEPESVAHLHQLAAQWYAEQQLFPEAITHACDASDFALAADLIERSVQPQSWRNAYHTLRRWLSRLPEAVLLARPHLCFLAAQAHFMTTPIDAGSIAIIEASLSRALQGFQPVANPEGMGGALTFQAALSAFRGAFEEATSLAQEALVLLPEADVQWRGHALSILGLEALMEGSLDRAQALLQHARVSHEASGHLGGKQFVTLMQAEMSWLQGDCARAAHGFRQVFGLTALDPEQAQAQLTDTLGNRRAHFERAAWYSLAGLLFEENRLDKAAHALQTALMGGQFALIHVLCPGLLLQVRLLSARGEEAAASALLEQLLSYPQPSSLVREIKCCQAYLAFRRGDLGLVASWATGLATQDQPLSRSRAVEEGLLLARFFLAEGHLEEASRRLSSLLQEEEAQGHLHAVLQIQALQVVAAQAAGKRVQGRELLTEVVTRACPAGYVRLFLEEGEAMEQALRELLPELRTPALRSYVRSLLRAATAAPHRTQQSRNLGSPSEVVEPLTPQEQRVLCLLAEGESNQQIAKALVISMSAVKKHVSHLLAKLHVENRTQAVVRARDAHLLPQPPHTPLP